MINHSYKTMLFILISLSRYHTYKLSINPIQSNAIGPIDHHAMRFNLIRKENLTKMIESGTVQPNFTFVWGLSFSKLIHSTLRSDPQALRKSP